MGGSKDTLGGVSTSYLNEALWACMVKVWRRARIVSRRSTMGVRADAFRGVSVFYLDEAQWAEEREKKRGRQKAAEDGTTRYPVQRNPPALYAISLSK